MISLNFIIVVSFKQNVKQKRARTNYSKHNFTLKWPIFVCFTPQIHALRIGFSWHGSICALPKNTEMLRAFECVFVWTLARFVQCDFHFKSITRGKLFALRGYSNCYQLVGKK